MRAARQTPPVLLVAVIGPSRALSRGDSRSTRAPRDAPFVARSAGERAGCSPSSARQWRPIWRERLAARRCRLSSQRTPASPAVVGFVGGDTAEKRLSSDVQRRRELQQNRLSSVRPSLALSGSDRLCPSGRERPTPQQRRPARHAQPTRTRTSGYITHSNFFGAR